MKRSGLFIPTVEIYFRTKTNFRLNRPHLYETIQPWFPEVRITGSRSQTNSINSRVPIQKDGRWHWIYFRNNATGDAHTPPANPPVIVGFHQPNAASFRFRILQANSDWTPGSVVQDSGWKKIAVWLPDTPLAPGKYLVEYWYKTATGRIFKTPPTVVSEQRLEILQGHRTVTRATTQNVIQFIYSGPKPDPNVDRHAVWARFRTEFVNKGNNSSLPTAYGVIQRLITHWNGTPTRYSIKSYFQHLETNQNHLENGNPELMQRNETYPFDYILDPNNPDVDPGTSAPRPLMGKNSPGYIGFRPLAGYILMAAIIYLWHPNESDRNEALKFLKFFLQKLFQTVLIKDYSGTRQLRPETDPDGFGKTDNFAKSLWAVAFVYDLLYDEIKNASPPYNTIIGEGNPGIVHSLEEGIRIYSLKLFENNYKPSLNYSLSTHTEPHDARCTHPYESHMQDNQLHMYITGLAFNKLLGTTEFERFVDREIHRFYSVYTPWSLGDIGDNEGGPYIEAQVHVWGYTAPLLLPLGINLRSYENSAKRLITWIYSAPRGAQEWSEQDSYYDTPEYNSSWHERTIMMRLVSHFVAGNDDAAGANGSPEGMLFRSYAKQKNFWGTSPFDADTFDWAAQARVLPALIFYPSLTTDLENESELTALPLENLPDDYVSKITKIGYLTTGVAHDQRKDRILGGRTVPRVGLRFIGLRLRRQSHAKDAQNTCYFTAGGELIVGANGYAYGYDTNPQRKEYAIGTFGYNVPVVLPANATPNSWTWNTTADNIPIRRSQPIVNDPPTVSFSEIYFYKPTSANPEIGECGYIEHRLDPGAYYNLEGYKRRVLLLKDWPAMVILDEVTTKPGTPAALLWTWWGHNYVADADPAYNANNWAEKNRSPFENLGTNLWLVFGARHGAWFKYYNNNHLSNSDWRHPAQWPRFAARFGCEGPVDSTILIRSKAYRPFQPNTIYRDPSWDPTYHYGDINGFRRCRGWAVPHPLAFWTTTTQNSNDMNQNIGYIPGGTTFRVCFWCVPYRIRQEPIVNNEPDETQEAPIIPNAHDENIWISARKDLPDAIEIGVFNNATTGALAKKGFIAKFRTEPYNPEQNAVEITFLANEEEWTSWLLSGEE